MQTTISWRQQRQALRHPQRTVSSSKGLTAQGRCCAHSYVSAASHTFHFGRTSRHGPVSHRVYAARVPTSERRKAAEHSSDGCCIHPRRHHLSGQVPRVDFCVREKASSVIASREQRFGSNNREAPPTRAPVESVSEQHASTLTGYESERADTHAKHANRRGLMTLALT